MKYKVIADTDIGIRHETNEDSLFFKHAVTSSGTEVLFAVVCDGMGGLDQGELASGSLIRFFSDWFDKELPEFLRQSDLDMIGEDIIKRLKELNQQIQTYGKRHFQRLGSTFTGMLFIGDRYLVVHAGDSRIYRLHQSIHQMTTDHTFVAREVRRGTMTPEQAQTDKRRHMLIQCVGVSERFVPEVLTGKVNRDSFLICTDGFRNRIEDSEIFEALNPSVCITKEEMSKSVRMLIEEAKRRKEQDNISALYIVPEGQMENSPQDGKRQLDEILFSEGDVELYESEETTGNLYVDEMTEETERETVSLSMLEEKIFVHTQEVILAGAQKCR